MILFFRSNHFLSQWKPCFFTVSIRGIFNEPRTFNCMEQMMMYAKAMLFNDKKIAQLIMNTSLPKQHKRLGRQVQGFNNDTWKQQREEIVFQGNYAKFTQNKGLKLQLLNTDNEILAEASPYDKIWGIGLSANNPQAQNPQNWKGLNLLGRILMQVRQRIRTETQNVQDIQKDNPNNRPYQLERNSKHSNEILNMTIKKNYDANIIGS